MDTIDSEPISIKDAMHRYGISSPSTWAEWLEKAGIQSFKKGRERYIYTYQLATLDAIARERNRPINTSTPKSIESIVTEYFQEPKVLEVSDLVAIMTSMLGVMQFHSVPPVDPDESYKRLEQYAAYNWRIKSKDLAALLELKSVPKSPYMAKGFWFERQGREWKVSKFKE